MTKKTEVSGTPDDSLTGVELNQVSGGLFNFGSLGYLKANRSAVGTGDLNRDADDDVIVTAQSANAHVRQVRCRYAESLTLGEWKVRAVALMDGCAGTMPHREWRGLFVLGNTVEDAAKVAETYRQNTRAADPKRRR